MKLTLQQAWSMLRETLRFGLLTYAVRTLFALALVWPMARVLPGAPADASRVLELLMASAPAAGRAALGWALGWLLIPQWLTLAWLTAMVRARGMAHALGRGLALYPRGLLLGLLSLGLTCALALPGVLLLVGGQSVLPSGLQPIGAVLGVVVAASGALLTLCMHDAARAALVVTRRRGALRHALREGLRHGAGLLPTRLGILLLSALVLLTGELSGRALGTAGIGLLDVPAHQAAVLVHTLVGGLWLALTLLRTRDPVRVAHPYVNAE